VDAPDTPDIIVTCYEDATRILLVSGVSGDFSVQFATCLPD